VAAAGVDVRRVVAAALLQLGAVCVVRKMFDQAEDHLAEASEHAEAVKDVGLHSVCVQLQGEALLQLGKLSEARETYEYFIELAESLDDRRGQAVAYQQLGRIWAAQGDLAAARGSLRRSVTMDPLLAGTAQLVLGGVLAGAGQLEEAAAVLESGLAVSADLLAMGFVIQLALVRLRLEDIAGAEALFRRGIDRALALNSRRGGAVCMLALGLIARSRHDPHEAADWYDEAVAVAEDDPRLVSEGLIRKADLLFEQGDADGAMELYDECAEVVADVGVPELHAELLRQTGRCLAHLGETTAAVQALATAEEIFGDRGRYPDVLTTLVSLSWVLSASNRPSASAVMRGAGRIAEDVPPSASAVVGLLLAGDGARVEDDLDSAWNHYHDARRMAIDTGAHSLLADCRLHLALVTAHQGKEQEALSEFAAALAVSERQKDHLMAMHVRWTWGVTAGDRRQLAEAAVLAEELRSPGTFAAAQALLSGDPSLVPAADAEFTELLWLRRRRASDGEISSGDRLVARVGPSIDDVVRELAPLPSGVSNVPAVVTPSV
ncbi:tetratricopeptide repeat protein, partial [Lentzea sp.]|uniref:tetratricopeptide repeat protein n=1 Tax=Lentzea sp. TaxID=56099 RepID=UPI002C7FA9AF